MQFTYRAKRDQKTEASGVMEAIDLSSAVAQLKRMGLYPLEVVAFESEARTSSPAQPGRGLSRSELALWARTVGQGLAAGLSLTQSLRLVAEQEQGRPVGQAAKFFEEKVSAGLSLAGAMELLKGQFPPVAVSLVKAGEAGGALEEVLRALAEQSEAEEELIAKVQGALWYPLFVLCGGFVTVAALLWVVVPRLALLFAETGQPLPWLTRLMISSGKMLAEVLGGALLGAAALFWFVRRSGKGIRWKEKTSELLARLPLLGGLVRQAEIARFSSMLSLLIGHGLTLPSALRLAADTLRRPQFQSQIRRSQEQVVEGMALSSSLRRAGVLEPFLLTLVAMGEAQGDLAQAFGQASDRYRREVDRRVQVLSTLIEPVLILLVGLVVGAIVVSMVLPIFQINFAVE